MHNPIMKTYTVVTKVVYNGVEYAAGSEIQLVEAEAAPLIADGSIESLGMHIRPPWPS